MEKFNELEKLVFEIKEDIVKFYEKGNKKAGVRVRKTLQEIKAMAQEIRKDISAQKNA
jgi:hypothetical protein